MKIFFKQLLSDESGNYSVEPFDVQVFNSLNDGISNEGIFECMNECVNKQVITDYDIIKCKKIDLKVKTARAIRASEKSSLSHQR